MYGFCSPRGLVSQLALGCFPLPVWADSRGLPRPRDPGPKGYGGAPLGEPRHQGPRPLEPNKRSGGRGRKEGIARPAHPPARRCALAAGLWTPSEKSGVPPSPGDQAIDDRSGRRAKFRHHFPPDRSPGSRPAARLPARNRQEQRMVLAAVQEPVHRIHPQPSGEGDLIGGSHHPRGIEHDGHPRGGGQVLGVSDESPSERSMAAWMSRSKSFPAARENGGVGRRCAVTRSVHSEPPGPPPVPRDPPRNGPGFRPGPGDLLDASRRSVSRGSVPAGSEQGEAHESRPPAADRVAAHQAHP
jgi:hypothetical protein